MNAFESVAELLPSLTGGEKAQLLPQIVRDPGDSYS